MGLFGIQEQVTKHFSTR